MKIIGRIPSNWNISKESIRKGDVIHIPIIPEIDIAMDGSIPTLLSPQEETYYYLPGKPQVFIIK